MPAAVAARLLGAVGDVVSPPPPPPLSLQLSGAPLTVPVAEEPPDSARTWQGTGLTLLLRSDQVPDCFAVVVPMTVPSPEYFRVTVAPPAAPLPYT
jgi:hypothetical protein